MATSCETSVTGESRVISIHQRIIYRQGLDFRGEYRFKSEPVEVGLDRGGNGLDMRVGASRNIRGILRFYIFCGESS
ncbi:uncharacterized protein G2W53_033965 [Senna tora]|uniref:Uncharacterized protein n=1 Tax=Senna tora TaxID=362788 RepID=A0A834WDD3_9FABA|nr:uncharacterized protein G2W53_033965 [Senna tora]